MIIPGGRTILGMIPCGSLGGGPGGSLEPGAGGGTNPPYTGGGPIGYPDIIGGRWNGAGWCGLNEG